ncbi:MULTISPECIES: hypothetical protein [unclassified Pseudomonas]|uniref:hypothetical protein n=1 Tax=unclassified Pseudomonas TaxID=196821 RepID=UPI000BCAF01A|nr:MULTISPECIES: hypothetical protein [unclassified Pseudomonas]PVZ20641.1 hypothetical protein F474_01242 [Pseudomonas sp. URIL14HWK12:I12]PVZ27707.1 hypothetical protein F470_00897 [Pseudomonas sp. URIL14HWK12:I10]PVZ38596.1 hypothetical protein F472_01242 [Pseudomonas sp. URIL14HWK12:I11]SNZ02727.1 hypothetical protein SAMN05660463_00162 [Pseudomonas sp. URIL14HWK12:I9]
MRRLFLGLACLALSGAALAFTPAPLTPWQAQRVDGMDALDPSQPYANEDLGFTLATLPGPVYQGNGTDDGVLVLLGDKRTLTFTAAYAVDDTSTREAMTTELAYGTHANDARREPATLGGEKAEQAQWRDGDDLALLLVRYRPDGDDSGVIYSALLHTTPEHQQEDVQAFQALLKGFRTVALPHN